MWTTGVTRSDPEKVFIQVKNGYSTASLTVGQLVCLSTTAKDGITVTRPATANLALLKGVVKDASIAYGDYGEVQCYGYNADALVAGGSGATTAVVAGDKLSAKNGVFNAIHAVGTLVAGESGVLIALDAFTTTTAAAKKVEIRCM